MRVYWSDYDADTQHLTAMQHGIYLMLIKNYWQRGGPLPNDDGRLARIAKCSLRDWRKHKPVIMEFFTERANLLHHSRIAVELARVEAKSLNNKRLGNTNAKRTQHDRDANGTRSHIYTEADTDTEDGEPKGSLPLNGVEPEPKLKPQHVVDAWNETASRLGLPQVKTLSRERLQKVKARIREHSLEDFQAALATLEHSDFLRGNSKGGWRANFDFFCQKSSFIKLVEGTYVN